MTQLTNQNINKITENDKMEYLKLIQFIQEQLKIESFTGVGFDFKGNEWYYGQLKYGSMINEQLLKLDDKENICQRVYEALVAYFGENLDYGYEEGSDLNYFVDLGSVMVMFPNGFNDWKRKTIEEAEQKESKANKAK